MFANAISLREDTSSKKTHPNKKAPRQIKCVSSAGAAKVSAYDAPIEQNTAVKMLNSRPIVVLVSPNAACVRECGRVEESSATLAGTHLTSYFPRTSRRRRKLGRGM